MINLQKIQLKCQSIHCANDWSKCIELYGYAFSSLLGIDQLRVYAFRSIKVIIDFDNHLIYVLNDHYEITTLANRVDGYTWDMIIKLINGYHKLDIDHTEVMLELERVITNYINSTYEGNS